MPQLAHKWWNKMNDFNSVNNTYAIGTNQADTRYCESAFCAPLKLTSNVSSFCVGRGGRLRTACSVIFKICVNTERKIKLTLYIVISPSNSWDKWKQITILCFCIIHKLFQHFQILLLGPNFSRIYPLCRSPHSQISAKFHHTVPLKQQDMSRHTYDKQAGVWVEKFSLPLLFLVTLNTGVYSNAHSIK